MLLIPLQADTVEGVSMLQVFAPFLVVLVIFYFMLIRPQQKHQKKRKEMIDSLKKGDNIVTIGGIHGEISLIDEDYFLIKVADNVNLKITRGAVGQKLS